MTSAGVANVIMYHHNGESYDRSDGNCDTAVKFLRCNPAGCITIYNFEQADFLNPAPVTNHKRQRDFTL